MAAAEKKSSVMTEPVWIGIYALSINTIRSRNDGARFLVMRHNSSYANGWRRTADKWDGAVEMLKPILNALPDSARVHFYVEYADITWTHLPQHMPLNSFHSIESITIDCYPTLEQIDLRDLPNLTRFALERRYYSSVEYIGQHLRISGLAQCPRLQCLSLFGVKGCPYLLRINAPFRNLRSLTNVSVGSSCINRQLPLELGYSPSLEYFHFNGKNVTRSLKAKRSLVMCLCIALHRADKSNSFVRALVSGPIHDPSLIHDIATVKLDN